MSRRTKSKKRKKDGTGLEVEDDVKSIQSSSGTSEADDADKSKDLYVPYFVTDYTRRYPEDSPATEFVVFLESTNNLKPIGTRDLLSISSCIKRFNKGVKYLRFINKHKIGVYFEKPGLANAFLNNKTFFKDYQFCASIPAATTEVTGIIRNVPVKLSNKKIFTMLSSQKKIICVKRFLRKSFEENGFVLQPTQTVAITFASSILPDFVDLDGWRHDISVYIPPVKQCFQCLRYGHMAKYCKNSERCSICKENHSYKTCTVPVEKAKCVHCDGNHISISPQCPIKKNKIKENQMKYQRTPFSDLFNENNFPLLGSKSKSSHLLNILKNDNKSLTLLVESIVKMITLHKNNETTICSSNVMEILNETFSKNNPPLQNSPHIKQ